jgi:hypothetical protein
LGNLINLGYLQVSNNPLENIDIDWDKMIKFEDLYIDRDQFHLVENKLSGFKITINKFNW